MSGPRFGEWTPVGEALPELSEANGHSSRVIATDGVYVGLLTYARNMYATSERNREPRWESASRLARWRPTHWMPLPEPPKPPAAK